MAETEVRGISRRSLLTALAAGAAGAAAFPPRARAAVVRPKLTLLLVAEQFRSDYLFRNLNAFSPGGFRRLIDEAAFFPDCRLLSSSFTLTGLATIATGSYAAMHGIVADRWYDRATRQLRAASPADLAVTSLFQQEPAPSSRFFAIAGDANKAGLFRTGGAGTFLRQPDSSFAAAESPGPVWLAAFNQANAAGKFQDRSWMARGAVEGAPALRTLTYDASKPRNFQALLASSPFAQTAELNLVRELIRAENLGAGEADTVVVVLDSIARLGSETGAVSPLIDDEVLSLDADISALLEFLDARGHTCQIVFTGAHGAASEPSPASRVAPQEIVTAVEKALAGEFAKGNPDWRFVEAYIYPFLHLRTDHLKTSDMTRARRLAGSAAVATGRVNTFMTADGDCPNFGEWTTRAQNSLYRARSGDVLLVYQPGFVESAGADRGIGYGSLWNYDAQVPLLLKGPSFSAGRFDHRVELTDIAPTLAAVAGIPPPAAATGRVLTEAFGEGAS